MVAKRIRKSAFCNGRVAHHIPEVKMPTFWREAYDKRFERSFFAISVQNVLLYNKIV